MSGTDKDTTRRDDERPMLIIGADLPDVEDTTPEELARQQEEARREIAAARRRAQEEIERKRREAEQEIAALEASTERELAARERKLDRTARTLYKRETRLRRSTGADESTKRLVARPEPVPLRTRGLRRSGWAQLLGVVAAGGLLVGLLTAIPGGGDEVTSQVTATDEARALWLQSGLATDELIALRMAGQEVPDGPGGTPESLRLAQEADALVPDSYYLDRVEDSITGILDEQTSDVRALTLWKDLHEQSGYAVGSWEVEDLVDETRGPGGWSYVLLSLGVLALAALAVLAGVARSWVALPVLVVATALGVAALWVTASGDATLRAAQQAHEDADDVVDDVYDQLGDDLEVVYGTRSSIITTDEDYWNQDPFYPERPGTEGYLAARDAVGDAQGQDAAHTAAVGLVDAGQQFVEAHLPAVGSTRAELVATIGDLRPTWGLAFGLGVAGAVLGGAGVVLSRGRERTS